MKNSDLVVITTAQAKPEKEKIVQQALHDVAKAARAQSGCIEYHSSLHGESCRYG